MTKKALVLGADSRILLSVVRSLGRGGVRVHIASEAPDDIALRSRYVRRSHLLPAFADSNEAWKNAVIALMRRERFDLVIPCTELEVIACQRHREELQRLGKVYVLDEPTFAILVDKFKTAALARSLGVPAPREIIVSDSSQQEDILAQFTWPVVLKPARSLDPARPHLLQTVCKAYHAEELQRLLAAMLANGPVAVQENFIGTGVGVELLLDAGKPLLAFQHCRVHEPLHGGPSSYRKSQALSPELLEASLKILGAVHYTGVAMVEFKVNERLGSWTFIEVNPRFWGSLPLALAAGADFPLALFQFLVEGQTKFRKPPSADIYCRNWSLDLDWQQSNFRADRSDPTLACRPLLAVLKDAFYNSLMGNERSDAFTWDDPRPGLAELRQIGVRLGAKLWRSGPWAARKPQVAPRIGVSDGKSSIDCYHQVLRGV